uniref:Chondroitin sulfate proteoglycan 4bb n=1 Tax=Amphilophus citrinellus TaxID=61819 RepID=A0A3Q0T703_AMPCI
MVFVHNGALSGGFHFQVNDGVNFAPRQIFSTTAHSLILTLQRNHPMEVYPGSVTPITEKELHVVTNIVDGDAGRNQSVVFAVTSPPKLGRLVRRMPDNSTRNVSTFTQSMLNEGVILYDQNKPESVGWSAADTFSFTVSLPPVFLPPHTFTILISYQANEHHDSPQHKTRLLNNAGAVVAEGGRVTIDRSKLDASNLLGKIPESHRKDHHIMYRVISFPRYGILSIRGHNLTRYFSQVTLNKFGITYIHDDSETTSDSFTFRAWVAPLDLSSSSSLSSLSMFNITVTPVNDQPPLIRSRAPSMKVVVGERVVLGPDSLQVEDHDTPPEELHYLVISKPNNGYLTLGERPEPVTSFTQYDVNHGRLHFIQQGDPSTGVFYFNVTDGHHRPLYKLFSLEVIKPSVSIVNNTGLSLVQGRTAVVLTTNQLAAQTNGQSRATISYTLITPPRHGRIAINDQEVVTFLHKDLQFGRVVYHMTDLSESEDSFQMSVSALSPGVDYGNVTATVKVTVRPLIYLREPVRVPSGIAVKLGKAMIDASELARISRANPVFEVLSPPKHGKLVKVKLLVVISQGHAPATPRNDSFSFLVRSGNVQPAKGELHFTILPHHQIREHTTPRLPTHNRTTTGGARGVGRGGSSAHEKHGPVNPPDTQLVHVEVLPRPASDPLLIILPLLACLLLIIILIVLILVFRHRKEKQARLRLVRELAAVPVPTEDSPYLGRPERSVAMPSVMVTPLGSASCPTSPRVPTSPRRSLAPGMTFWGPFETGLISGDGNIRGCNSNERDNTASTNAPPPTAGFRSSVRSRSPTPTLKESQYWV